MVPIKIGTPAGMQVLKKINGGAQLVPIKIGTLAGMQVLKKINGGLAQLARALAWHARGRRFDPDTLHQRFT